jgi:pimeloyl-ACP methyl ester carboxylesterase
MLLVLVLTLGGVATLVIARTVEARYPPLGHFLDVGAGRLHLVERKPEGRSLGTVVLIPGASSSVADPMMALGDRLAAKGYRVVAIDRPGQGWSERIGGPEAAAPARQAAVLAEALHRLGIVNAVAVGHSWAGAVLPNLALDHADVVGATLYLAPVTHPWPGGGVSWHHGPLTMPLLGPLLTRTLAIPGASLLLDAGAAAVFAPQAPPPGYQEAAQVPLLLRPQVFQANAQDVAGLYQAVTAQRARYPAIRVPTTIIAGEADPVVWTQVHARGLARDVPGARLIILPGVGHMPHHAAPDLVVAEIEALAARIRSRALSAAEAATGRVP